MVLTANAAFTERHTLRTVQVADPAAGDRIDFVAGPNEVVQVVGVKVELTTGPFVDDRRMLLLVQNVLILERTQASVSSIVQPEDLTWTYYFSCGIAPFDATADAHTVFAPLACGIQLQPTEALGIMPLNLQVLDQIHDIYIRFYGWKED